MRVSTSLLEVMSFEHNLYSSYHYWLFEVKSNKQNYLYLIESFQEKTQKDFDYREEMQQQIQIVKGNCTLSQIPPSTAVV